MIPDYQTLMLPLLHYLNDGKPHLKADAISVMRDHFKLSEEEFDELLPSKRNTVFHNRIHWARAHLKMAGLIQNLDQSLFAISERGKFLLKENPKFLNIKFLMEKYPDYKEKINTYRYKKKDDLSTSDIDLTIEIPKQTPEELLDAGYLSIRKSLEHELLLKLKAVSPSFFERIVVKLLVKMGYGGSIQDAGKAIGKSGDEGIDGIIKEDKLGLDVIYIQAKRWEGVIGRPELHKFVGALAGQGAKKGVFITTSSFTKEAADYTPKIETKIVLIDGIKLAQYMIDYNLGVSIQNTYEIKKIDSDYFEDE